MGKRIITTYFSSPRFHLRFRWLFLPRFEHWLGLSGPAQNRFASYLLPHTHSVRIKVTSSLLSWNCSVPSYSLLDPCCLQCLNNVLWEILCSGYLLRNNLIQDPASGSCLLCRLCCDICPASRFVRLPQETYKFLTSRHHYENTVHCPA